MKAIVLLYMEIIANNFERDFLILDLKYSDIRVIESDNAYKNYMNTHV
jgi:hypothetical protein